MDPSERELTVDHVRTYSAAQSSIVENHDFRVEPGGTVIIVSPNPLLMGVWAIQRGEYNLLWIDVCKVGHYIESVHIARYHRRIVAMAEAACRHDIPVIMAGDHRPHGTGMNCTIYLTEQGSPRVSMPGAVWKSASPTAS